MIGMRLTVKTDTSYKMVAPLNTHTMIEERGIVWFLWTKGMAAKDVNNR
jgi:hypothetical protein